MCPLRIILIFLSATLAGFFVLKNLKSPSAATAAADSSDSAEYRSSSSYDDNIKKRFSFKVRSAMEGGFWTCVDMASGRYLWRHLVAKRSD